jgi:hypothetical protein
MTVALAADFNGQIDFEGGRYTAIPWHERFRTDHQWSGARVAWDPGQVEITFVKQGDGTDSHLCRKASRPPTLGTISPAAGPASSTHYRVRSGPPGRDWPDPGRVAWPPSGNYASTAATSTSSASSAPQVRRPRPMTETEQSPGSTHPVTHVPGSPARLSLGDLSRLVSASGGLSAAAGSRALLSMTRSLRAAHEGGTDYAASPPQIWR